MWQRRRLYLTLCRRCWPSYHIEDIGLAEQPTSVPLNAAPKVGRTKAKRGYAVLEDAGDDTTAGGMPTTASSAPVTTATAPSALRVPAVVVGPDDLLSPSPRYDDLVEIELVPRSTPAPDGDEVKPEAETKYDSRAVGAPTTCGAHSDAVLPTGFQSECHAAADVLGVDDVLVLDNCSFSWGERAEFMLDKLSLRVAKRQFVACVGRVGSGKTTLLSSILGETTKLGGSIAVRGSIAYVAQDAFIRNASVRDNITFGRPFDSKWYARVVRACALATDFEVLPHGDLTDIGTQPHAAWLVAQGVY